MSYRVRCSALSGYPDCGRRVAATLFGDLLAQIGFEFRPLTTGVAAYIGTSVHSGAKMMLDVKARSGELPPLSTATDSAIATLREDVRKGVIYADDAPNLNAAEQHAVRLTTTYRMEVAPQIMPILVEERLEAVVPWTHNQIILSGQADVLAREPGALRDLKTSAYAGGSHNPQLGGYAWLVEANGYDIQNVHLDTLIRNSLKKPPRPAMQQTLSLIMVKNAAANVLRHIDADLTTFLYGDDLRGIRKYDPWSWVANPKSMLCGPKFCKCFGVKGERAFCNEYTEKF